MADNARKTHVSPGVYQREVELNYAVKSLGLTTLGVVGETVKGPAFQPMSINNWEQFQDMFGGTNTEKFKGTQYPKYELPYIAKSYLSESKQLEVCRVLGLSGYNAGPAWAITNNNNEVVAVLRSRGYYTKYEKDDSDPCSCGVAKYDKLHFYVGEFSGVNECQYATHYNADALTINPYYDPNGVNNPCDYNGFNSNKSTFDVSSTNYGKFTLSGFTGTDSADEKSHFFYPVTLNPTDNNYILKVLGTSPTDGETPIYVESLYDVAHIQGIESEVDNITSITSSLTFYDGYKIADFDTIPSVDGFVTKEEGSLSRKDLGKRYLYSQNYTDVVTSAHTVTVDSNKGLVWDDISATIEMSEGQIYTVRAHTNKNGKRSYYYTVVVDENKGSHDKLITASDNTDNKISISGISPVFSAGAVYNSSFLVKNDGDGLYYRLSGDTVERVTCDLNDYKSQYRFASTPWFVSNVKGDAKNIKLDRLFRFHTISDGTSANEEVKVSIKNISVDNLTFDVEVRYIYDTDASPVVLESFSKCNLIPGTNDYICHKIGSYDGSYETKSKYITVEVNETLATQTSVPCGFVGYPLVNYAGTPIYGDAQLTIKAPTIRYNGTFDEELRHRKQYFGLSDIVGVDIDMFKFKGNSAYIEIPEYLSNGFHLDPRVNPNSYNGDDDEIKVTVDGYSGYSFDTVSVDNTTQTLEELPIIGTEIEMEGCIYEYKDLRKFTAYFYGGFDGWDEYRTSRTNTDDFKYTKYRGKLNDKTGEGFAFNKIKNPEVYGLNQKAITSDWYAYLSAIRQFANPESVDINVFATPGIDFVNNTSLVGEVIEMIEEERADSIYVMTTPDKPSGANDYVEEMYTAEDIVAELEDSEIDSNYTTTYYPWVKYYDQDNYQYINLPATKDVVRNMAMTDNVAHPWFAPAGLERGNVNCVKAHKVTKLSEEDTLYDGRINIVKTFSKDGVKIWGQRNLQIADTQLNRIAIRRLLLRMRKLVAVACLGLIFEPNDATTKDKFLSIVTPILDNIRANRGITDYRITVDDSQEARDRRELPAKIYFKPINCLEYIPIDFILTSEGVSFDNI